jgi:hypothetical protein
MKADFRQLKNRRRRTEEWNGSKSSNFRIFSSPFFHLLFAAPFPIFPAAKCGQQNGGKRFTSPARDGGGFDRKRRRFEPHLLLLMLLMLLCSILADWLTFFNVSQFQSALHNPTPFVAHAVPIYAFLPPFELPFLISLLLQKLFTHYLSNLLFIL